MATEVVIRQDSNVRITVSVEAQLYTIRLLSVVGATFTLDLDGNLMIGQSSVIRYSYDSWCLLQKEIEEGRRYMARVKMSGSFGKLRSISYIKPSTIKPNSIYQDMRGRYILYLGSGYYSNDVYNREGAKEGWGIFNSLDDVKAIFIPNKSNELYLGDSFILFDHYCTKPSKLVGLVKELPLSIDTYITKRGTFNFIRKK